MKLPPSDDVLAPSYVMTLLRHVPDPTAQAALVLAYLCGLRAQETVSLTVEDVDLEKRLLRLGCERGTGGKSRYIPLSEPAQNLLESWLQAVETAGWLFPRGKGHVSILSLNEALEGARVEIGIPTPVSLGTLRRSICTYALEPRLTTLADSIGHLQSTSSHKVYSIENSRVEKKAGELLAGGTPEDLLKFRFIPSSWGASLNLADNDEDA